MKTISVYLRETVGSVDWWVVFVSDDWDEFGVLVDVGWGWGVHLGSSRDDDQGGGKSQTAQELGRKNNDENQTLIIHGEKKWGEKKKKSENGKFAICISGFVQNSGIVNLIQNLVKILKEKKGGKVYEGID